MPEKINRIKSVLADKDISQKDLATKIKITPNSMSRICQNATQPSLKLLKKIAIILDVEMGELLVPIKKKG